MGTNVRKLLNLIVISGEKRYFIFWKKKFELYVYFTPMKKKIADYKTYNIKVEDLNIDVSLGLSIDTLINWSDKRGYTYTLIERHAD